MIKIKTQKSLDKYIQSGETEFEFVSKGKFEINSPSDKWIKVSVSASMKFDISIVARGSSRVEARESSRVEARESSSVEAWGSSSVVAWESSSVEARESSSVVARESSSVVACGSSRVVARGSSSVEAWGSSRVEARGSSSVEARGSSRVVARESSSVEAWGSSSVVAWESSSVEARESSSVVARESSSVVACGSSRVVARGSSSVEAWGSSRVEARESSRVEARGFVGVNLWGKATAKLAEKCHAFVHSKNAKVDGGTQTAAILETPEDWCEYNGVEVKDGIAIVYKALHEDFSSNHDRSFFYLPNTTPVANKFDKNECSYGLHFCASPKIARGFLVDAKKFMACPVKVSEMLVFFEGLYPEKCKVPRLAAPCWEVDEDGNAIEVKNEA
ncbi:hypothetical protein [Caudoviricetes sp.]|nr:hypothetical protein [Caudoviricetes sp.]